MKNKKIIISLMLIFAIMIIAVGGALYFFTDVFKTEQQLFYKYISKIEIVDSEITKKFNEVNKKILKNNSFSKTNIDFETRTVNNEIGLNDTQKIFSIESDAKKNISSKQDSCDLKLVVMGQDFLTLRYLRDDNTYALKIDKILKKYLAVENSNLKELFSKLGVIDTGKVPDSIQIISSPISEEKSEDLKKHIKDTYGTLIYNSIEKENFYKELTQDKKTTVIGVALTNYDLINLYKNILQTLNNDTKILNLIVDTNKEYGSNSEELTVEALQSKIQEFIKQLEDNSELEEKEKIKISLTKSKQNIVLKINIELYTEQISGYETINGNIQPKYEKLTSNLEIDFSKSNEIVISLKENANAVVRIVFNYLHDDNTMEFDIKIDGNNENSSIETKYTISDYNSNNITTKILLELLAEDMEYALSVHDVTKLNEEIQIPRLTTENSAKLNDMSSEDLNEIFVGLQERLSNLFYNGNGNIYEEAQNAQKEYEEAVKKEEELLNNYQEHMNSNFKLR